MSFVMVSSIVARSVAHRFRYRFLTSELATSSPASVLSPKYGYLTQPWGVMRGLSFSR